MKFNLALLVIIAFSIFSAQLHAGCKGSLVEPQKMTLVFGSYQASGGEERKAELQGSAQKVFQSLSELLQHLNVPEKFRLHFIDQYYLTLHTAGYFSDCIVGFDICLGPDHNVVHKTLNAENMISNFAHEIGHAIFTVNMANYIDFFKLRLDTHTQLMNLPSRENLFEKNYRLSNLEKDLNEKIRLPKKFLFELDYEEIFGDLLAILMTGKPNAIHGRNFEDVIDPRTWQETESHVALNPVRSFIWHNYLHNLPKEKHPQFVADFFKVLASEVVERWNNPKLHQLPPPEVNIRLIKKLAVQFNIPLSKELQKRPWYKFW